MPIILKTKTSCARKYSWDIGRWSLAAFGMNLGELEVAFDMTDVLQKNTKTHSMLWQMMYHRILRDTEYMLPGQID